MPQVGPQAANLLQSRGAGSGNNHAAIRACLLEELRQAVRACIRESVSLKGKDTPLTADLVCVATLCNAIEMVLKHGLVHKNSSDPSSFWWFICDTVRMDPQFSVDARLAQAVATVDKSHLIQTPTGKHRGWIRHALNSNSLSELLTMLVNPDGYIAQQRDAWYSEHALIRTEGEHFIAGIAAALSCIKFKLPVNDEWLDRAFVRPNKGVDSDSSRVRDAPGQGMGSASEITAAGRAVLSRLGNQTKHSQSESVITTPTVRGLPATTVISVNGTAPETALAESELERLRQMNTEIEMVFESLAADMARINAQVFECAALANSVDDEGVTPLATNETVSISVASSLSPACMAGLSAVTGPVSYTHLTLPTKRIV
eukprot:TRINITY_DN18579_c0_g1_i5.p1 TRINITY_DN18579_c0_g1~~TRINITY_DN18579_c0_g1_i5.p1  ORF type:complete len:373 (-),score=46.08 TRINITY_DN18579_c0_g1_i5:126-1244(-)